MIKVYTAIMITHEKRAYVLYQGTDKDAAEMALYEDKMDEPAPDKNQCTTWAIVESSWGDWTR